MPNIIGLIAFILGTLITLVIWALLANAILSWLIAFDVVNMRNRAIYQISRMLDAVSNPILRPIRRFVPPLGGVDVTPIIVIVVLFGIQKYILDPLR
jgi:YggT family protein